MQKIESKCAWFFETKNDNILRLVLAHWKGNRKERKNREEKFSLVCEGSTLFSRGGGGMKVLESVLSLITNILDQKTHHFRKFKDKNDSQAYWQFFFLGEGVGDRSVRDTYFFLRSEGF